MENVFILLAGGFIGLLIFYRVLVYLDIVHEHRPDKSRKIGFDGASLVSRCKCGARIMQDSQGGWF